MLKGIEFPLNESILLLSPKRSIVYGDKITMTFDLDPQDAEARLLAVEGYPIHRA